MAAPGGRLLGGLALGHLTAATTAVLALQGQAAGALMWVAVSGLACGWWAEGRTT